MSPGLIILLSVHLLLALGWLGGEVMTAFVIGPGIQRLSLQSRYEFVAKVLPRAITFVEWMIIGTGVSGAFLSFATASHIAANSDIILAAVVLALIAAGVEVLVTRPSFKRMASLADALLKGGQTAHPMMIRYERRARWGSLTGSALLVAVLVLMVVTGL